MSTTKLSDELLTEKFRRENAEQFFVLVRMHLSFVLDIHTDENEYLTDKSKYKKWNSILLPFSKKSKYSKSVIEGAPLTQEGICQVYQLIEFLKKPQNIVAEGIFRRTGSLERQQELRSSLSQGVTLQLEGGSYTVHDCASVLKGFLAELPDPLLTEAHFPAYCQIAELCGIPERSVHDSKLLEALQLLLLLLPGDNKILLKDILDLLHFTAAHEDTNKMSPENLAKLFTPHLLCPRKLSPEHLLSNSQMLFGIVSFMIRNSSELFKIPSKLVVEFRARYENSNVLTTDGTAANTVFTFVDHERTAKENEANPTETALAQLYAHIQSLPESSKKRKLIKQFNKENGHGTPRQLVAMKNNKSFGDSIKKHIFQKGVSKKNYTTPQPTATNLNQQQQGLMSRSRLFCGSCDSSTDDESLAKKLKTDNIYITSSTPAVPLRSCPDSIFTPDNQDRKSMSPITRSTQRMTRAMQETMMTPRSRKPVLVLSGTNINSLPQKLSVNHQKSMMDSVTEEEHESDYTKSKSNTPTLSNDSLTGDFREYLNSRDMLTMSPSSSSPVADLSFSSRTDDFISTEFQDLSDSKMTDSLLYCLDGNLPPEQSDGVEESSDSKELVLKPKQFDENGKPIIFETSF